MPARSLSKSPSRSVSANVLKALRQEGVSSEVLEARLQWAGAVQLLTHYIKKLEGVERVFPSMIPTQASGRWSTKGPPLPNVPDRYQNVVWPDPGSYWIKWDYSSIEAKIVSALCQDQEDLEAFEHDHDIHTLTACKALGLPFPPVRTKALHTSPECAVWREQVGWKGAKDPRRDVFKVARYGLAYGYDANALLGVRGVEDLGITRAELLKAGQLYLRSKPRLAAWKKTTWTEAYRARETRTFLGRRRRLFPTAREIVLFEQTGRPGDTAKEGLNHIVQGAVADVLNLTIIEIAKRWPECYLVLNAHDSGMFSFPLEIECWPEIRESVEREWEVTQGGKVRFTAEWVRFESDGSKQYYNLEGH